MESVWLDEEQLRNRYWDSMKGKLKKETYNWKFNKLLGSCRAASSSTVYILFTAIDKHEFSKFLMLSLSVLNGYRPLRAHGPWFKQMLLTSWAAFCQRWRTPSLSRIICHRYGAFMISPAPVSIALSRVFALGCCSWCCTSLREKDGSSTKSV